MNLTPKCRFGGHQRTASNEKGVFLHNSLSFCCPAHTWVTSDDTIFTKDLHGIRTSVSGQFPANARCLHLEDGPTQRIFIWPLSGESKLYLNDVDMSRSLQVPASGGAPYTRCGSPRCICRTKPSVWRGFCTRRLCNGDLAPCRISLGVEWDPE